MSQCSICKRVLGTGDLLADDCGGDCQACMLRVVHGALDGIDDDALRTIVPALLETEAADWRRAAAGDSRRVGPIRTDAALFAALVETGESWHPSRERILGVLALRSQAADIIEVVPGKVSGAPVLKGTRMPISAILDHFQAGMSVIEIAETWRMDRSLVRRVVEMIPGVWTPDDICS